MSWLEQIEQVEIKVRQLASKLERLEQENTDLRQENEQLKAERDRQTGALSALKYKLERSQQKLEERENVNDAPEGNLRDQIDHYLQEIDTCIEWLSQQ